MRMSCNGCRVLRKGCSENCSIRPCLQWIKSPESQANATVFLAKFYGRAGLVNLINSGGPHHLRPAIFRSLLYEACGRIVNPIYGSVGLLWSDSWHLCQAAVESVLKGEPIVQIPSDDAARAPAPPLKAHDIRHASGGSHVAAARPGAAELHGVRRDRTRFKRAGARRGVRGPAESSGSQENEHDESSLSHVSQGAPAEESEVELELTLGFEPRGRLPRPVRAVPESRHDDGDTCHVDLWLELSA